MVTHLLFADETLLFCQAYGKQNRRVQAILKRYIDALGQVLNKKLRRVSVGMYDLNCKMRLEAYGVLPIANIMANIWVYLH